MTERRAIEAWLCERLGASRVTVERFAPTAGGASRATFALDVRVDPGYRSSSLALVLRLASREGGAEGLQRQFRLLRVLASTTVPAPRALWYEPDAAVLGEPFVVMRLVEGDVAAVPWFRAGDRRVMACAEALARVHALDWTSSAGRVIGEPAGTPMETELGSWSGRVRNAGLEQEPMLLGLAAWLRTNEPADARFALTHGDPNAGNFVMRDRGVAAVLDWEMAGLGDPRSDLGFYAAVQWLCGGFPGTQGRTVLSDAYEEATSRELASLVYYEAWGLYRMAVILASRAKKPGHFGLDAIASRLDDVLGRRWAA